MKKLVLLCTMLATLCCLAYAEYQINAPGYEAAKDRYYQLVDQVVNGTATGTETAELSDLCQVYGFDPLPDLTEERGGENLDQGGVACETPTDIPSCPYSDTGVFDGDNDCAGSFLSPYNDVFYSFRPTFTGRYQMRARSYSGTVAAIRVMSVACCTGGTSVAFSSSTVAMDCQNPYGGMEPATVVTYLYAYLTADVTYWIHVGTSSATVYTSAYEFDLWCWSCPRDESQTVVHNSCLTAETIACTDSIFGDSAYTTAPSSPDWYKIVVPDVSPMAESLYVFVGARELGHCISGRYPYQSPVAAVDGRFTLYKERPGEFCVIDSIAYGYDEGCSYDAVQQKAVDPGTYYIKVWNAGVQEYVLKTRCIEYNPIMACCFPDASCLDMLPGQCAAQGGWTKPGVQCGANPCPPTTCPGDLLDIEPLNNTCNPGVPQVFCNGWYCGVIPMVSDTDWYQFVVPEAICETLIVDIYGNDTPSKWPFNQGLDPVVRLISANCATVLGTNWDNNGVDPLPVLDDSRLKYTITLPGTYYIQVYSEYALTGPYLMHITCVTCPPPPPNDACANAITVGIPSATPGYTMAGTIDTPPLCVYTPGSPGVWYRVTGNGYMVTADVCISSFDTRMNVYSGTCANLVCVGADDDNCNLPNGAGSTVTWCAQYGVDYYILVYGYSTYTGTFTLTITQGNSCGTGACCSPTTGGCTVGTLDECTAQGGVFRGYGTGCTPNPCPPPCLWPNRDNELVNNTCGPADPVVACGDTLCGNISAVSTDNDWYQLVIPSGVCDTVVVKVFADDTPGLMPFGLGLDPTVYLYASDCVTQLAYNDDNYGVYPEPVTYDSKIVKGCLVAGTYYIRIVSPYSPGPYVMVVQCIPCECPHPCEWYTLCGTPGEVEPNDLCPPPVEQAEITCDATVYGLHCPSTDKDFWKITIAPMSIMTIKVYTGMNCDVNPAGGVLFRYYNDLCLLPSTGTASSITLSNSTANPLVKYLEVYDSGTSQTLYKVVATCCEIRNYCLNPIDVPPSPVVVPPVYVFDDTVNTCCATDVVDSIRSESCTVGYLYKSGPDVVFEITLRTAGVLNIVVRSLPSGDGQFMVFTDCLNPRGTCVASHDYGEPETINNLALAAGTYYISVSRYTATACGDMWLHITSDVPLPVELMGDVLATAGSEKVTLTWATASETNNDHFEIVRNERVIGSVTGAGTSPSRHDYAWSEEGLNNGMTYTYTLRSLDINSAVLELATVSATPSFAAGEVTEYALHQNYPNPFNPVTTIAFDLLEAGNVSLKIYNLMGQEVRTVVNGTMPKGRHVVSFDAGSLASGVYLYRVEVNGFAAEKKMLLMK